MMHIFFMICLTVVPYFAEHFVSFIIPCYNCERWISQSVGSIYEQHLQCPFEIVCTDDGSTDLTYDVLLQLKERYPAIRIFRHSTNQGGSAARNTCVKESKGDLIFCLDADNLLKPDVVQRLIDRLDETDADIATCGDHEYFHGDFISEGRCVYRTPPSGICTLQSILIDTELPAFSGNYLYTRESYDRAGGYPTKYSSIDTFAFCFCQLKSGCKLVTVPNTSYWHRTQVNGYYQRSYNTRKLHKDFINLILDHSELFEMQVIAYLRSEIQKCNMNLDCVDPPCLLTYGKLRLKTHVTASP